MRWWAFVVFAFAMVTDRIDGDIARSRGLITDFGKVADPIADKALVTMAFVGLSIIGDIPWWITVVILVREWGITAMRFWVIRHGVMAAGRGGKVKTLLQALALGFFVIPALLAPAHGRPRRRGVGDPRRRAGRHRRHRRRLRRRRLPAAPDEPTRARQEGARAAARDGRRDPRAAARVLGRGARRARPHRGHRRVAHRRSRLRVAHLGRRLVRGPCGAACRPMPPTSRRTARRRPGLLSAWGRSMPGRPSRWPPASAGVSAPTSASPPRRRRSRPAGRYAGRDRLRRRRTAGAGDGEELALSGNLRAIRAAGRRGSRPGSHAVRTRCRSTSSGPLPDVADRPDVPATPNHQRE